MSDLQNTQDDVKAENRIFPPPAEFAASAAISGMDAYHALCKEAEQDYEGFWGRLAREHHPDRFADDPAAARDGDGKVS